MLPLGRIVVARSHDKRGTKTTVVRWMPVHPALAVILRRWLEPGFAETMGRPPEADDLLPAHAPATEGEGALLAGLADARQELHAQVLPGPQGARHRTPPRPRPAADVHLARPGGRCGQGHPAARDAPAAEGRDGALTTVEWWKLCEEVAKLRISLGDRAMPAPSSARGLGAGFGAVKEYTPLIGGVTKWRRRESNATRAPNPNG